MSRSDGLIQRRNVNSLASNTRGDDSRDKEDNWSDGKESGDDEDHDSKETRLTLMEEILLLGLKDKEVFMRPTVSSF